MIGITQGFIAAGASTVIASLWPVNDYSTKEMMKHLYEFLCGEGHGNNNDMELNVCSALRQAMIGMLRDDNYKIRDWAPFLVYGLSTVVENK